MVMVTQEQVTTLTETTATEPMVVVQTVTATAEVTMEMAMAMVGITVMETTVTTGIMRTTQLQPSSRRKLPTKGCPKSPDTSLIQVGADSLEHYSRCIAQVKLHRTIQVTTPSLLPREYIIWPCGPRGIQATSTTMSQTLLWAPQISQRTSPCTLA